MIDFFRRDWECRLPSITVDYRRLPSIPSITVDYPSIISLRDMVYVIWASNFSASNFSKNVCSVNNSFFFRSWLPRKSWSSKKAKRLFFDEIQKDFFSTRLNRGQRIRSRKQVKSEAEFHLFLMIVEIL